MQTKTHRLDTGIKGKTERGTQPTRETEGDTGDKVS